RVDVDAARATISPDASLGDRDERERTRADPLDSARIYAEPQAAQEWPEPHGFVFPAQGLSEADQAASPRFWPSQARRGHVPEIMARSNSANAHHLRHRLPSRRRRVEALLTIPKDLNRSEIG